MDARTYLSTRDSIRVQLGLTPRSPADLPSRALSLKAGDLFAIIIRKITGAAPCPNKCRERNAQMNKSGWFWCWRNRATIAGWLADEARWRGHTITDAAALDLLRAAFKELATRKQPRG